MIQLLIIADDFTGALDSGVQFAACGARTLVVVGAEASFDTDAAVLVVDAETRHLSARQAYEAVYRLTAGAMEAGVSCVYKKTDSALRGNIGAELTAVLEASGEAQLPFLPAFPQIGRTTEHGVHLISGVPVAESVFGTDPFEPVRHSDLAGLIGEQSDIPVRSLSALADPLPEEPGILVFDCTHEEEMTAAGGRLREAGRLRVAAGCAGFAAILPGLLGFRRGAGARIPALDPRLLVVSGSVNPITAGQIREASRRGFCHMRLTPEQTLAPGYWASAEGAEAMRSIRTRLRESPLCIIDTNDSRTEPYARGRGIDADGIRLGVARSVGRVVREIFTDPALGTLLITGGDTLLQCMQEMGVSQVEPVCELEAGVVLSRFTYQGCTRYVISKSGGFGKTDLLTKIAEKISRQTSADPAPPGAEINIREKRRRTYADKL